MTRPPQLSRHFYLTTQDLFNSSGLADRRTFRQRLVTVPLHAHRIAKPFVRR